VESSEVEPSRLSWKTSGLALGALGVVFGDIGTSPLYAIKECFNPVHGMKVEATAILGVVSLFFWTMTIVISLEYGLVVLRADNRGEGGILALGSLATGAKKFKSKGVATLVTSLIVFGAALICGDGAITPAISVLSAVEGLSLAVEAFNPVPLTLVILFLLFSVQRFGTHRIGAIFGPIMLLWFTCLGLLGIVSVFKSPGILAAINPFYAVQLALHHRHEAFLILGSVFLCVTGGEAMYADLGHFGKVPIRMAWYFVAMPALLLNYFGQGAYLLRNVGNPNFVVAHPFFELAPRAFLIPMVALATTATVIASQALISGVFSLTRQAMRLGYCPRMAVVHTSAHHIGQIYMPVMNWLLFIVTAWLVVTFQSSSNLASAYGVAVSMTMVLTTGLSATVALALWKWKPLAVAAVFFPFFCINSSFFSASLLKLPQGGWVAVTIAFIIFVMATTWIRGRRILIEALNRHTVPLQQFLRELDANAYPRVHGTAVFMTGNPQGTPFALVNNFRHNKVVHERVLFLTFQTCDRPHVPIPERFLIEPMSHNFFRVVIQLGFMDEVDIPESLLQCAPYGLEVDLGDTTFFVGREFLLAAKGKEMSLWRQKLFLFLSRNAQNAIDYFNIPPSRVVELGMQVETGNVPSGNG
jgi:KUP system potassium uptake protein